MLARGKSSGEVERRRGLAKWRGEKVRGGEESFREVKRGTGPLEAKRVGKVEGEVERRSLLEGKGSCTIPILPINQSTVLIRWSIFAPVAVVHRSITLQLNEHFFCFPMFIPN